MKASPAGYAYQLSFARLATSKIGDAESWLPLEDLPQIINDHRNRLDPSLWWTVERM